MSFCRVCGPSCLGSSVSNCETFFFVAFVGPVAKEFLFQIVKLPFLSRLWAQLFRKFCFKLWNCPFCRVCEPSCLGSSVSNCENVFLSRLWTQLFRKFCFKLWKCPFCRVCGPRCLGSSVSNCENVLFVVFVGPVAKKFLFQIVKMSFLLRLWAQLFRKFYLKLWNFPFCPVCGPSC